MVGVTEHRTAPSEGTMRGQGLGLLLGLLRGGVLKERCDLALLSSHNTTGMCISPVHAQLGNFPRFHECRGKHEQVAAAVKNVYML